MRHRCLVIVSTLLLLSTCDRAPVRDAPPKIGILQDKPQEWADALKLGFTERLVELKVDVGKDVVIVSRSAAGDPMTMSAIAETFATGDYLAIYTLGTQSTQEMLGRSKEKNIIFGAVTDPQAAGLITPTGRAGNLTGTQDLWPYGDQFDLIQAIRPAVATVGIIYNASEANSLASVKSIRAECARRRLRLVEKTITSDQDVPHATGALLSAPVALIFIPADNTAQAAASTIIQLASAKKIPVFTGIAGIVENGALATVGTNYFNLGKVNADQMLEILRNKKRAADVPLRSDARGDVIINRGVAQRLGVVIPAEWYARAAKVIE